MKKTKQWLACLYIFPLLLLLTACNESNGHQTTAQLDETKKPVMRCAP